MITSAISGAVEAVDDGGVPGLWAATVITACSSWSDGSRCGLLSTLRLNSAFLALFSVIPRCLFP